MKLLYCIKCDSIVRLITRHRQCECGKCGGKYLDNKNAIYYGGAMPLGLDNYSFAIRLNKNPEENLLYNLRNKLTMDSDDIKCFTFGKGSCFSGKCSDSLVKKTRKEYLKLEHKIK